MRPLRLELEGFTAFRDRISLDLTDLDLFAITGPTGAGKSSLVDAMAYALYGRVPRVANRVEACISQGLSRMFVELEFEAGNDRYRIFREARRQGRGNIRMERLAQGEWEPLEDRATGVEERVKRILGLDFDGFTRSVLLPQGQFQEFLAGSPDKRREVLRGLLRLDVYERVRARASERERGLRQEMADAEKRLREDYADATPENLAALESRQQALAEEARTLEDEVAALDRGVQLARDLAAARGEFARARADLQRAESEVEEAEKLAREGGARIEQAKGALEKISGKLAVNSFDAELFARLTGAAKLVLQLNDTQSELAKLTAALAQRQKDHDGARVGAANAAELVGQFEEARQQAEEELRHAQRHNAAAAVREGLALGERCPVCGAVVGTLLVVECPDLEQAQSSFEKARRDEDGARDTASRMQSEAARTEAIANTTQSRVEELKTSQNGLEAKLGEEWPEGQERSIPAITQALDAQAAARVEQEDLQRRHQSARTELEGLQAAVEEATLTVAQARGRRDAAKKSMEDATDTGRSAVESLVALARDREWAEVATKAPTEDVRPILEGRLENGRARLAGLQGDIGGMAQRIEQLQEQIQKRASIEADLKSVRARHDVTADLAQVLRADRFQAFVQGEALRLLAEEGSRRLTTLSGGRYSLSVASNSQDFDVVDQWNAEEARSVRTLSGGETFLASFSLALALAEALPGLAVSGDVALDSMFLDEGFGSLDPEALDRAAEALDSLRAANRMVCVITHLHELADRLPARVIVQKSEAGSTVEVV